MPFIIGFGNRVAWDDCDWRFSVTLEQKNGDSSVPDRLAVLVRREMFPFSFAESGVSGDQWSPMSPETMIQTVRKAPAATSVHLFVRASSRTRPQHRGTRTRTRPI